ncbi:MAG: dihydroxy-acid dehydratase [Chloroflexi bacterium]|nr:dihydroxy-acid dehydratase [Chloroflexota bacterium]
MTSVPLVIESDINPYRENVQAKANEPITVAGLLDRARRLLGYTDIDCTLEAIYDRLEANAPRVAIIGGSWDHPAHIVDLETALRAAYRIWQRGGVPFYFGVPVMCDGTAQSTMGMSYSLQSRNAVTQMVVSQMEGQCYHGAFVIQGCDKTPLAIVSALALLDRTRQERGEPPVFATFAPAHVLRGGTIPDDLWTELEAVAVEAEKQGYDDIAYDLRDAMSYILQCSSNTAFQGVLIRARELGLITAAQHKGFEKRLAVNTCDAKGGVCAFNGTGNSSRHVVSAFGLVHPAVELLTEPPTQEQINAAVDAMLGFCNDGTFSVRRIVVQNIENAVRVHAATGGSTNLMMHIVAAMIHAGYDFSVWDMDRIRRAVPVPDLFDYSLTQGRDIFVLAQQCRAGQIRGMETMIHELVENGVPMRLDAPTVTGTSWRERLSDPRGLEAENVRENPIILHRPKRPAAGVDVLTGNFFESAVVKISGMPEEQIDEFDEAVALVLYYENEDEANQALLDVHLLDRFKEEVAGNRDLLLAIHRHNTGRATVQGRTYTPVERLATMEAEAVFDVMVREGTLKIAMVISGQGPAAYGMPEMFTPMQHINANRAVKKLTTLISDGRFSGVSYGAAIGHVTPEALNGGHILYLRTGDALHLRLRARRIDLLDPDVLARTGETRDYPHDLPTERAALGEERLARIRARQRRVAPTNRLTACTDAAHGVVPLAVAEEATEPYPHAA